MISLVGRIEFPSWRLRLHLSATRLFLRLLRRYTPRLRLVLISLVGRIKFPGRRLWLHLPATRLFLRLLRRNAPWLRWVLICLAWRIKFPGRRLRLHLPATLLLCRLLCRRASRLRRVLITTTERRKFPVGLLLLLSLPLLAALLIRLLRCGEEQFSPRVAVLVVHVVAASVAAAERALVVRSAPASVFRTTRAAEAALPSLPLAAS